MINFNEKSVKVFTVIFVIPSIFSYLSKASCIYSLSFEKDLALFLIVLCYSTISPETIKLTKRYITFPTLQMTTIIVQVGITRELLKVSF